MALPDVAVVGGGIVGAATAAYLADAGARVTLYERGGIAAGASGRNSGVVQHPMDEALASLHRLTLDLYADLAAASDRAFSLPSTPAGLLFLTPDAERARAGAASVAAAQPHLRIDVLDQAAVAALEPSLAPGLAACRVEIGYPVTPAAATHAFANWATARGATVRTSTAVGLDLAGSTVTGVRTQAGIEPAGAVVVAAGPWSPALIDPGGSWRPIVPLWGVVVAVALARPPRHVIEQLGIATEPGDEGGAGPHQPEVEFSLVTAGGSSSVGSTFLLSEPDPAEWEARILRAGAAFVPAIATAPVIAHRACARPFARDGRPLVGRIPGLDRAYIAAGHGPWGISTGPASARQVADLVLGRTDAPPIPATFDPARFGLVHGS